MPIMVCCGRECLPSRPVDAPRKENQEDPRVEEAAKVSIDFQDALRNIRIHWLNHIVHEMRGPLFAARGYSKLLLDEKGGPVTATQRKYLETTLDSLDKISATIDRLHDLKAQEKLELESVDLA